LNTLWNKKVWNPSISYQTQFLKYDNKVMKNIIKIGKHALREEDSLHLVHQFIPTNATQIAYVYHQGYHFQALIPEN
jgi:hypothetical protein